MKRITADLLGQRPAGELSAGPESARTSFWRRRASSYNRLEWTSNSGFLRAFLQSCPIESDAEVLDIGTGTGIVARLISPHVARVTGIDISAEMVAQWESRSPTSDPECRLIDVQDMEFPSESFDLATARMVFHHVEDCDRGLQETLRVLKRGGHLVLAEGVPPDWRTRKRYVEIFKIKEKRHTFSEAELINLVHRNGFRNIALYPYFMEGVSLRNWLDNSALTPSEIEQIYQLHRQADAHFWQAYNMREEGEDLIMDWKFCILVAEKSAAAGL